MASVLLLSTVTVMLNLSFISSARLHHGCRTHCGDVEVPYPFGIGIGCAIEQGFEINCSRTADSKHLGDPQCGQSRALMTIPTYCYNYSTREMDAYIWGFKLTCMFISIGCNTIGYIYNTNGRTRDATRCASVCGSPGDLTNGSCVGVGCCQNVVPKGLMGYNVYFYDVDYVNTSNSWYYNPCSYAGLVETKAFFFSSDHVTTSMIPTRDGSRSSYACRSGNSECVDSSNGARYLCNCSITSPVDAQANVNECEQSPSPCSESATCQNIVGGYYCSCPFGSKFAKETNSCTNRLIGVVIGLSSGIGVLLLAVISILLVQMWKRSIRKRVRKAHFRKSKGHLLEQLISSNESATHSTKIFSLDELEKATTNFDSTHILGRGGNGTVYKGILLDQRVVAIKKSKMVDQREIDQFVNELAIVSQINHQNVVKLFWCCLESEMHLLVYEFISNGTLSEHLHGDQVSARCLLTSDDRIRIASEAASALAYLHSAASIPIFHRDVTSANILLTDNLTAKVADFGASRSISIDETCVVTTVQGTFGYLDPEYYRTRICPHSKYFLGLPLLLTRQKPIFLDSCGGKQSLCHYFVRSLQDNTMMEIINTQIVEEDNGRQIDKMASLVRVCLRHKGEERPTMKEVELRLQLLRGKMVVKKNHALQMNNEAVPLLPSNYFGASPGTRHDELFSAANSSSAQGGTRCYTME
ncbi:hypothetical protein VPH35_091599 [Triticum aestivum]